MITNIIFDLSDVLIRGTNHTGAALMQKHELSTRERLSPFFVSSEQEFLHGNISEDVYLDEVLNLYPELGDKNELKHHIRDNFTEVEGTRDIILRLKKLGYRLALLSIHAKEWMEYLEQKYKVNGLFDAVSYSYQDKVSKPDKKAFELILQRLSAKPEECVFIDDVAANVQVAKALGMKTIQFSSAADLDKKLKRLLPNYAE